MCNVSGDEYKTLSRIKGNILASLPESKRNAWKDKSPEACVARLLGELARMEAEIEVLQSQLREQEEGDEKMEKVRAFCDALRGVLVVVERT